MSESHELHCYAYVTQPYERVSEALIRDGVGLFDRATAGAAERAKTLIATLRVSIAGFEIGKDIVIHVTRVDRDARAPASMGPHATHLDLEWRAERAPALFPTMRATLMAYPLSNAETQLDLRGVYDPPGGVFGNVADRLVGKRIADAAAHTFVSALAHRLNQELA